MTLFLVLLSGQMGGTISRNFEHILPKTTRMLQSGLLLKQGGGLEGALKEGIETSFPEGGLQTCLASSGYHPETSVGRNILPQFASEEGLGIHQLPFR